MTIKPFNWIFVLGMMAGLCCSAQDNSTYRGLFTEVKFNYGFILPHHESMRYLQRGHISSYQVRIGRTTSGKHNWESLYRFPSWGLGYYYTDLQYPKVLGNVHAVFSFIDIPVTTLKSFTFVYKFAFGLSYITKPFDPLNNYYNIAIGSHENVYLNLCLGNSVNLSDKCDLTCELSLTHYSNGSIAKPNLGINVVSCGLGLRLYPQGKSEQISFTDSTFKPINELVLIASTGWKRISPAITKNYLTSSISAGFERSLNRKKKAGVGFDLFYDASITRCMDLENAVNINPSDNYRPGIHVMYDMIFGDVAFTIQWGYYIFVKWNTDGSFYHRFGLKYYFSDHFLANLTIKTHFARADFIEWGIGYHINLKDRSN